MEVNLRGQEQEKPQQTQPAPVAQGVAQLQKIKQRGSFPSEKIESLSFFSPHLRKLLLCLLVYKIEDSPFMARN